VPKVPGLFGAVTGLPVEMPAFPLFTHEAGEVAALHPLPGPGDLPAGDRGFCSFAHLALLHLRGVLGLFRVRQRQAVDFRPHRKPGGKGRPTSRFVARLGKGDRAVDWLKPKQRPDRMTTEQFAALPASPRVREVRYRIPPRAGGPLPHPPACGRSATASPAGASGRRA
jgi:hypothetical protein